MNTPVEEIILMIFGISGMTLMVLMIPCGFASMVISYGNERIKFFDDQLCKDPNKRQSYLHADKACRFKGYSYSYPWIRHRAKTTSKWFKVFMWVNSIHYYCWPITFILAIIIKWLDLL